MSGDAGAILIEDLLRRGAASAESLKNIEDIDAWLTKAVDWTGKIDKILGTMDKYGLLDLSKKVIYKKMELQNVNTGEKSIVPKSDAHKILLEGINAMTPEQLQELASRMSKPGVIKHEHESES